MRFYAELEDLLARSGRRPYTETIPVLASYWLKTVFAAGHNRAWWKNLDRQLVRVLAERPLDAATRESVAEIQAWIHQELVVKENTPGTQTREVQPFRAKLTPERLAPYTVRLLNEWLPAEVASVLTNESELFPQDEGIPALASGKALERILLREHLSPASLELLLDPQVLSPEHVYPADAEILRDVVLALLGRTAAPAPPVMPPALLLAAADSSLPPGYSDAVRNAALVACGNREELHVSIPAAHGLEILKTGAMHIGSIVVTMDGRWWESEKLQSGEEYVIVYRPGGLLRIDYSADHAKLAVPWPQSELRWRGEVHVPSGFAIFGREWRPTSWEANAERTWLHLEFSRVLHAEACLQRSHPAAIDIAWNALESALAQASADALEQLRHTDLIPLGRALFELVEFLKHHRPTDREMLETKLRAIQYFQAETAPVHGRVPFRVLPAASRKALLKAPRELLIPVFDELPVALAPSQAA